MAAGWKFTHTFTFGVPDESFPPEGGPPSSDDSFELLIESAVIGNDYFLTISGTLVDGTRIEQTSEIVNATPADVFAAVGSFLAFFSADDDLL